MTSSLLTVVRDLHRRKARARRGLTVLEGIRLVEEALAAGVVVRGVVIAPSLDRTPRGQALHRRLDEGAWSRLAVSDEEFADLAATEHPQGVLAVVPFAPRELAAVSWPAPAAPSGDVMLLLDGLQDPGNVGTILRTAWALGAAGVIALPGTAELGNPKVLRAAMGATFHLPLAAAGVEEVVTWIHTHQAALWVAEAGGAPIPAPRPLPPRLVLAVGNEGAGGRAILEQAALARIGIPLRTGVDSLNVAVAAAILLYEVTRAR